ncbi:transmembrane protein 200A-like [Erpetoichthys calabaricus]|uniref:Transmembrane protein 200B n=1 Tax=Erpetoichthys calabaricus TaxID=27687 RepID=A0A8C4T0D0_ERPCA|nr:transmembrane protein 200A-like [Erpetoichthys calabaricus]
MTAATGAWVGQAMRRQEPSNLVEPAPFRQRRSRFRRWPRKETSVKGKLRIKSPSGAFLILGVFVVLVGVGVAVAGYWPNKGQRGSEDSRSSSRAVGVRNILSAHSRLQNDRMKLLGPVIMGVGLFIFICANTMLYENRDKETRLLLTQQIMDSMMAVSQSAGQDGIEDRNTHGLTGMGSPDLNIRCLDVLSGSDSPTMRAKSDHVAKWAECCRPTILQTQVQFIQQKEHSPSLSLHSIHSDSCNSSDGNVHILSCAEDMPGTPISAASALLLPVIKVNNWPIESGNGFHGVTVQSAETPTEIPPGIESGTAVIGDNFSRGHVVVNMDSFPVQNVLTKKLCPPELSRKEFTSDTHINMAGHSKSLDLGQVGLHLVAPMEERKNRSWPRLDLCNIKWYTKLGEREDTMDKLLDQLEQQLYQWEQNCNET